MNVEQMQSELAERLTSLLDQLPEGDRDEEMVQVLSTLENEGISVGDPDRSSPKTFSRDLFMETPSLLSKVQAAAERDFNPESAESPHELVANL
jgi:hypothetical protein